MKMIIETGITTRSRLKLIEKVSDDFGERHFIMQHRSSWIQIFHIDKYATSPLAQLHNRANKFVRHHDTSGDIWFFNFFAIVGFWQLRWILYHEDCAISLGHFIYD